MDKLEKLKVENQHLREECDFLRRMLKDERKFFLETVVDGAIEEYRQIIKTNLEHKKELQNATQAI